MYLALGKKIDSGTEEILGDYDQDDYDSDLAAADAAMKAEIAREWPDLLATQF